MRLLAIDPASKKTGIAIFDDETLVTTFTLESTIKDPELRRLNIAGMISLAIEKWNPDVIASEAPHLMGYNARGMDRLLGMIEWMSQGRNLELYHPMVIKKAMGSGSLDKLEVGLAAGTFLKTDAERDLLGEAISREAWDEVDAVAIGLVYYAN